MPIVNGTYVSQPLGSPKDVQNQVFGGYTTKDMADYSQAAYNYQMQQQQQAFELEMWNLKNQYDSPAAQMQRYQDAGLNPNLIYGQQNVSGNTPQGSPATFRSSGSFSRGAQNAAQMISQMVGIVKAAREMYDYVNYGKEASYWSNISSQEQVIGQKLNNAWNDYLLHGDNMIYGDTTRIPYGPRAKLYKTQTDVARKRYDQLVALCNMIPDQQARTKALKELDDYRLQIMQGQYGAIMGINTGYQGLDALLKMFGFYVLGH